MQFILLVLINLIMITLFYLILRIRLEKYASDYRERRLNREMGGIINEFNETAERNISILDNRIETMKKLLQKTGKIDYIDININDIEGREKENDESFEEKNNNLSVAAKQNEVLKPTIKNKKNEINKQERNKFNLAVSFQQISSKLIDKFSHTYKNKYKYDSSDNPGNSAIESNLQEPDNIDNKSQATIKKDKQIISNDLRENDLLNEFELENMFLSSTDKYLLINELHCKGYPTDLLSRCSGIPIGEIKLVLDLNNTQ